MLGEEAGDLSGGLRGQGAPRAYGQVFGAARYGQQHLSRGAKLVVIPGIASAGDLPMFHQRNLPPQGPGQAAPGLGDAKPTALAA